MCFSSEGRICCLLVQQRGKTSLRTTLGSLLHQHVRDCITVFFPQGRTTVTGISLLSGEGVEKWEQMDQYYFFPQPVGSFCSFPQVQLAGNRCACEQAFLLTHLIPVLCPIRQDKVVSLCSTTKHQHLGCRMTLESTRCLSFSSLFLAGEVNARCPTQAWEKIKFLCYSISSTTHPNAFVMRINPFNEVIDILNMILCFQHMATSVLNSKCGLKYHSDRQKDEEGKMQGIECVSV